MDSLRNCRAPGCIATRLITAHIIPQGIARRLSKSEGGNYSIDGMRAGRAKFQNGCYDKSILCASCDGHLGNRYDGYISSLCPIIPRTGLSELNTPFIWNPIDGSRFISAILAILWRASISRRQEWCDIDLGPYEDLVASVLFNGASLETLQGFEVVLERLASSKFDARRVFTHPIRTMGAQCEYCMIIGGFRVTVRFDKSASPFVAHGVVAGVGYSWLQMSRVRLEDTREFAAILSAATAYRHRHESR